jgi:hypothetical protein
VEKKLAVITKQDYVVSCIMLLCVTLSYCIKCQNNISGIGTCYRLGSLGFEPWLGKGL